MYRPKYIHHTLNSSPSKQAHSFGKAQRFRYDIEDPNYETNPEQFRTITFARTEFNRERSPSPNSYKISSQFENKGQGYSFGKIRNQRKSINKIRTQGSPDKIKDRSYLTKATNQIRTDGKFRQSLGKASVGVRMYNYDWKGDKYGYYSPQKNSPGPGAYSTFSCFGHPDRY